MATPLPGYLSTPGKRATRARALVPLVGERSRARHLDPGIESFTPALSGFQSLRKSVLGRSIPTFSMLEPHQQEHSEGGLTEGDRRQSTNDGNPEAEPFAADESMELKSHLFSSSERARRRLFASRGKVEVGP